MFEREQYSPVHIGCVAPRNSRVLTNVFNNNILMTQDTRHNLREETDIFTDKTMPILSRMLNAGPRDTRALERLTKLYGKQKNSTYKLKHTVLTEKEVEGANAMFKYFDKNKDDSWSLNEFKEYVKWNTNYGVNPDRAEDVFKLIDHNKNGSICVVEFLNYGAMKKKPLPMDDELEDMFNSNDKNEDGLISLDEVRQILLLLGEDVSRSGSLRRAFAKHDKDNDGLINVFEFKRFISENSARANLKKR